MLSHKQKLAKGGHERSMGAHVRHTDNQHLLSVALADAGVAAEEARGGENTVTWGVNRNDESCSRAALNETSARGRKDTYLHKERHGSLMLCSC
jgi:hypothetical protein